VPQPSASPPPPSKRTFREPPPPAPRWPSNEFEPPKPRWHSRSWWTAVGALVGAVGLIVPVGIAVVSAQHVATSGDARGGPKLPHTTSTHSSFADEPSTTAPSASSSSNHVAPPMPVPAAALYLRDLSTSDFLQSPYAQSRDPQSINGTTYASSYSFQFENCSDCTTDTTFNIPGYYTTFSGTFGLTDQSRHDNVIDGVEYFAVYGSTGALIYGPQRIEYPASVPFSIDITGTHRLKIEVTEGTNFEFACFCNAELSN
jgi:NPCBM/NEW2 domain